MEVTLEIQGMNCNACVGHVQRALETVPGVNAVRVELDSKRAVIEHSAVDPEKLCAAVADEGYEAKVVS